MSETVCNIRSITIERFKGDTWCDFCGKKPADYVIDVEKECAELALEHGKVKILKQWTETEAYWTICEDCYKKLKEAITKKIKTQFN